MELQLLLMPSPRRIRHSLLAVFVGVVVFGLLLEGGLRVTGGRFLLAQERHNRAALAQQGAMGVLCVGDSMTAGQYPLFLEAALEARLPGQDVAVFDVGRPSTNSWFVLSHLDAWLDRYEPRVVVAMLGINDSGRALPYRLDTPGHPLRLHERLRVWRLARLVASRVGGGAEDVPRGTPPYALTRELYSRLATSLVERETLLVAMQYPTLPAGELQELLAARPGVLVVDNRALFAAEPDPWSTIFVDRFGGGFGHLSDQGNRMLADHLAEALTHSGEVGR